MIRLICDGCDFPYSKGAELGAYQNNNPYAGVNLITGNSIPFVKMPDGWAEVEGKQLCPGCISKVRAIIGGGVSGK